MNLQLFQYMVGDIGIWSWFYYVKTFMILHDNNTLNGTKRGVFATFKGITGSDDPQIEVLHELEWMEVGIEGIEELGKVVRMMYSNSIGAKELIARASSRIVGPN